MCPVGGQRVVVDLVRAAEEVVELRILREAAVARLVQPRDGGMYFEAEVGVPEASKRALPAELLRRGVPATVLIKTGRRTLLAYLFEPILRARFNAVREH